MTRPLRFLMICRLISAKGVLLFCRSAEELTQSNSKAEFRIIGDHDPENPGALTPSDLDELARSPVRWLGMVADVRGEIAEADVVVLPTQYSEGVPRSLLEGMASGRPIITTDTSGCRDLVIANRTGILIPPGSQAALTEAMTRFIRNPAIVTKMGKSARRLVEKSYNEEYVVKRSLGVYAELLRSKI